MTNVYLFASTFALNKQTIEFIVKRAVKSKQMLPREFTLYKSKIFISIKRVE